MFATCGSRTLLQRRIAGDLVFKWTVARGIGPESNADMLDRLVVQALANHVILAVRRIDLGTDLQRFHVPSQWHSRSSVPVSGPGYGPYLVDVTSSGVLCNCLYAERTMTTAADRPLAARACAHIAAVYGALHLPAMRVRMDAHIAGGHPVPDWIVDLVQQADSQLRERAWSSLGPQTAPVRHALALLLGEDEPL